MIATAARLFFLTAVAISIATRPFKFSEISVTKATRSFASSIHSLVYKHGIGGRRYAVIHFVSISDKFGICTVVGLIGALVEAKIRTFKCPKMVASVPRIKILKIVGNTRAPVSLPATNYNSP